MPIKTIEDAELAYKKYEFLDPFEDIPPALLNPYDIKKYACEVGVIYPFVETNLKSATYGVPLDGQIHYWENNTKKIQDINNTSDDNKLFKLEPNSIVYISLSTKFMVPYYMVFRFNLRIDLVHKGLLLGTGPVVDAGFQGNIMVPLHNLTSNTYYLRAGEVFIWLEFTKMSPNHFLSECNNPKDTYAYKFADKGKNKTPLEYFQKVNHNKPITSSIPSAIDEAKKSAFEAEKSAKRMTYLTVAVALTIISSLVTWIYYGWNVTHSFEKELNAQKLLIQKLELELNKLRTR